MANVVAVGTDDGRVWLLASHDLRPLRCVRSASTSPITALAVAPDASSVVVGDADGLLVSWSATRPTSLQM